MRKNKNIYKIILDILMTAIMVVLMKTIITGMLWHEVLGIGIFLLFLFHKLINYKTLSGLVKKFKKITARSKSMLILDALLLIDFTVVISTGVMISQELFVSTFTLSDPYLVSAIHHSSAYIGLILISVHIGLHWSYIINTVKNKMQIRDKSSIRTILSRIAAVIIMIFGVQSSYSQNVLAAVTQPLDAKNLAESAYDSDSDDIFLSQEDNITEDQSQTTVDEDSLSTSDVTLEQYLSSLFCTLCPKHCPLSSPQCMKGEVLAQEATEEYYLIYGVDSESTDDSESDENINETDASIADTDESDGVHNGKGKRRTYEETTEEDETTSENDTTASQEEEDSYSNVETSADIPIKSAAEYASIMGLYIGGTHYLVKIPKKKK